MYLIKGPSVLDNSKMRSLILSLVVTVNLATHQLYITAQAPPVLLPRQSL